MNKNEKALRNFKKAYNELLTQMQTDDDFTELINDSIDIYPFKSSFDELAIAYWADALINTM